VYVGETKVAVGYCSPSSLEDENDPRGVPWCAAVCRALRDRAGDGFVLFLGKSQSSGHSGFQQKSEHTLYSVM
jgi:hypothetical protein